MHYYPLVGADHSNMYIVTGVQNFSCRKARIQIFNNATKGLCPYRLQLGHISFPQTSLQLPDFFYRSSLRNRRSDLVLILF